MIYFELFLTFFKIGLFTFGGGLAMLPLVQAEVLSHGWMTMEQVVNFVAVSESTPGPLAVNMSTYVGAQTAGLMGALCATLGVVLPSFVIILIIAKFFAAFAKNKYVEGAMSGLRPAVIAMIGAAVVSVGRSVFVPDGLVIDAAFWASAGIFALMVIVTLKRVHPVFIILLSAALGIGAGYFLGL